MTTFLYGVTSYITIVIGLLVVLYVYPEKRWRSRAVYAVFYTVIAVLIAGEALDSTRAFVTDLQMIINPMVNLLIMKAFFDLSFRTSLLWLWLYNMITDLLRIPLLTIRGIYEKTDVMYTNVLGGRTYLECVWNLLIISLFIILLHKGKEQLRLVMKQVEINRKISLFLCFIDVCALLLVEWMAGFFGGGYYSQFDLAINLFILLVLFLLFLIYMFRSMYQYNKLEKEALFVQKETMARQYEFIRSYCEKEAKRLHDVKHIFRYLYNCIETGELEQGKKCLEVHLNSTRKSEWKIWTGFTDLDGILNYEYERMQQNEIEFMQKIELYKLPVQGEDMMIILGNLLDNALDASVKCTAENRRVKLTFQQINNLFFLEVWNTVAMKTDSDKKMTRTDKRDKIMHGWGLENVRQIVEENHGEMQYSCENGMFIVKISFMEGNTNE